MFWNSAKPKASQQALEGRILSANHKPLNDAFKQLSLDNNSSSHDDRDKEEFIAGEKQSKTTSNKTPVSLIGKRKGTNMKGKDLFGAKDLKKSKSSDKTMIEDDSSNLENQSKVIEVNSSNLETIC